MPPPPVTQEQRELLDYLNICRAARVQGKAQRPGFHYQGMEDFLLEHGQWHPVTPWTGEHPEGTPRHCFGDAIALAAIYGLRYVEGIALSIIPVHHAWNVDAQGRLIDSTWQNRGHAYFGVTIPTRSALAALRGSGSVLDDYQRRWPIYRKPWRAARARS